MDQLAARDDESGAGSLRTNSRAEPESASPRTARAEAPGMPPARSLAATMWDRRT